MHTECQTANRITSLIEVHTPCFFVSLVLQWLLISSRIRSCNETKTDRLLFLIIKMCSVSETERPLIEQPKKSCFLFIPRGVFSRCVFTFAWCSFLFTMKIRCVRHLRDSRWELDRQVLDCIHIVSNQPMSLTKSTRKRESRGDDSLGERPEGV